MFLFSQSTRVLITIHIIRWVNMDSFDSLTLSFNSILNIPICLQLHALKRNCIANNCHKNIYKEQKPK